MAKIYSLVTARGTARQPRADHKRLNSCPKKKKRRKRVLSIKDCLNWKLKGVKWEKEDYAPDVPIYAGRRRGKRSAAPPVAVPMDCRWARAVTILASLHF